MRSGSNYSKLFKTVSFSKFVFQSYSIQTYLWLCSSAKWLPEREKSWFIQINIDSTTAKNIVYIQSLSKCPGNERVPVTSLFIFMRKNQVKALLQNVNSWPMHIPKSWVLELFFQVINCPVNQDVLQKWNQPPAQRKPFRLPVLNRLLASVFKWCKQLARDPYKGKKNEIKSICFNRDISNRRKVWSTTYQCPSFHTAFLSDRNLWIYTYIYIYIYKQIRNAKIFLLSHHLRKRTPRTSRRVPSHRASRSGRGDKVSSLNSCFGV